MKKMIIVLLMVFMIPIPLTRAQSSLDKEQFTKMAWHQYQSGRKCFEAHAGAGMQIGFEECLRIQSTCKLIYDGIASDENRKWLIESKKVKDYITGQGLKPLDYLHLLKLISEVQGTPKQ